MNSQTPRTTTAKVAPAAGGTGASPSQARPTYRVGPVSRVAGRERRARSPGRTWNVWPSPVAAEIWLGPKSSSAAMMCVFAFVNSDWCALPSGDSLRPALGEELDVGVPEVGIRQIAGLFRIGHVELHVAAVPVRHEHHLAPADLLDDDVVVEDVDEVRRAGLRDLREFVAQRVLGDEERLARIRDVDDVDVARLEVVDQDRVRPCPGIPREHAVDLVCGRAGRLVRHRTVAEALHERLRLARVRDVVEVEAAEAPLAVARLVVRDEQVAVEPPRLDVERLDTLARHAAGRGCDERDLLRARGVADVDHVDAVPRAHAAPLAEIGEPVQDPDIGDPLAFGLQGERRDALHVRARRPEMAALPACLWS